MTAMIGDAALIAGGRVTTPAGLLLTISLFGTAMPDGEAIGTMRATTWEAFAKDLTRHRVGAKDGPCFVPATFNEITPGRVRRKGCYLLTRTAIALDIETNKITGEVPPSFNEAVERLRRSGWAAALYTSHSHTPDAPRYRIVVPLSAPIPASLPAVDVLADALEMRDVLDEGKRGAASVFYLPACPPGTEDTHRAEIVHGVPYDADTMTEQAGLIIARLEAEEERQRARALEAAERRRAEAIQRGQDPDASIIAAARDRLDLEAELVEHGYEKRGRDLYLAPNSSSGRPGVRILHGRDGIERVFSHHTSDPLAACNLPSWCTVKAIDVVDVLVLLDFHGDRTRALRALSLRFGLNGDKKRTEGPHPAAEFLNRIGAGASVSRAPEPPTPAAEDEYGAMAEAPAWEDAPPGDDYRAPTDEAHDHAEPHATASQQAALRDLLSVESWAERDIPEPDRLLGDLLTTTTRVFIVGRTGLGKTLFGLAMAAGVASGAGFLHWRSSRPARVLYLDGEMPAELIKPRARDAIKRLNGATIPAGNLLIFGRDIEDQARQVCPHLPPFAPLNTEDGRKFLMALIEEIGGVDLIVFDNVMSLISGDQKDEVPWSETLPLVATLTDRRVGQLWLDHTGHAGDRQYGSSTKAWRFDAVGVMAPFEEKSGPGETAFSLSFDHPGKAQRWSGKIGQFDKWISRRHCGLMAAERNGTDDETSAPDALTGLQGQGCDRGDQG